MKDQPLKRVLFYTHIARHFRATHIGYLYQLCQRYPVVLLSEKLDSKTEEILSNKKLFPKLEKIIPVSQYETGGSILGKNKELCRLAKEVIKKYKPDVAVVTGAFLLESYLRRFAKDSGALTIANIGPVLFHNINEYTHYRILRNVYQNMSFSQLFQARILFAKFKKHVGHFLYHWLFPLVVGEKPFIKEPSSIFWWDFSRTGGVDYYFVFSKKNYDDFVRFGIPSQKLCILDHPLQDETRKFFEEIYFTEFSDKDKKKEKILTIMWPEAAIGFKKNDYSLIPAEVMEKYRLKVVRLISQALKGWKIFIKPHPMTKEYPGEYQRLVSHTRPISNRIEVIDPLEPADRYIESSDVIVGFPPVSNTIFATTVQCPEKPILSLDLQHELLGDYYKNSDVVEYIDNEGKLGKVLTEIYDNTYTKRYFSSGSKKLEGFSDMVDLLEFLTHKKI